MHRQKKIKVRVPVNTSNEMNRIKVMVQMVLRGQGCALAILEGMLLSSVDDPCVSEPVSARICRTIEDLKEAVDRHHHTDEHYVEKMLAKVLWGHHEILAVLDSLLEHSRIDRAKIKAISAGVKATTAEMRAAMNQPGATPLQGDKEP